jgi:hypothetical protein
VNILFIKMTPFDVYKTYLGLKNHFTKDKYDYHKYCGKTRASLQSFYKRKDRYWFEKMSRQKNDKEIVDFFVSNFVASGDANSLWIGHLIREGEGIYNSWKRRNESLAYNFKQETCDIFGEYGLEEVFDCSSGHPPLLKKFLIGKISMETLVIYNRIFLFGNNFDKKLKDPVWEVVSKNMKKYDSFLNIDIFKYRKIIKECVL